ASKCSSPSVRQRSVDPSRAISRYPTDAMSFAWSLLLGDARQDASPVSHPIVLRPAAAFRRDPGDDLVRVHDVARLAMNAVRRVDLQLLAGALAHDHLVDVRRAEALARVAVLLGADRVADVGVHEQVHRLILVVTRA